MTQILNQNTKNHVVQLVCLGGLSTFIPFAPKLFEIHVMPKGEKNEPQPKKLKKKLQCFFQMGKSTLGCHNFDGLKSLFKVFF